MKKITSCRECPAYGICKARPQKPCSEYRAEVEAPGQMSLWDMGGMEDDWEKGTD